MGYPIPPTRSAAAILKGCLISFRRVVMSTKRSCMCKQPDFWILMSAHLSERNVLHRSLAKQQAKLARLLMCIRQSSCPQGFGLPSSRLPHISLRHSISPWPCCISPWPTSLAIFTYRLALCMMLFSAANYVDLSHFIGLPITGPLYQLSTTWGF